MCGPEHPDTIRTMHILGHVLRRQGLYEDALLLHRQSYEYFTKILGADHPDTQEYRGCYESVQRRVNEKLSESLN